MVSRFLLSCAGGNDFYETLSRALIVYPSVSLSLLDMVRTIHFQCWIFQRFNLFVPNGSIGFGTC